MNYICYVLRKKCGESESGRRQKIGKVGEDRCRAEVAAHYTDVALHSCEDEEHIFSLLFQAATLLTHFQKM